MSINKRTPQTDAPKGHPLQTLSDGRPQQMPPTDAASNALIGHPQQTPNGRPFTDTASGRPQRTLPTGAPGGYPKRDDPQRNGRSQRTTQSDGLDPPTDAPTQQMPPTDACTQRTPYNDLPNGPYGSLTPPQSFSQVSQIISQIVPSICSPCPMVPQSPIISVQHLPKASSIGPQ